MGFVSFSYGALVYAFFLATFCYAIAFVGNLALRTSPSPDSQEAIRSLKPL